MKFNLTVVYKSKDSSKDYFIKREYDNIDLDLNVRVDDNFGGYYLKESDKINNVLRKKLDLCDENVHFSILMDYLGEYKNNLSFAVEALVPNNIIRKLKIEKVLDYNLV